MSNSNNGAEDNLEKSDRESVKESGQRIQLKKRGLMLIRRYSIELFSAVLIGLIVTVMVAMFPKYSSFFIEGEDKIIIVPQYIPPYGEQTYGRNDVGEQIPAYPQEYSSTVPQSTNRRHYVRSMLSQVMSYMSGAKPGFSEYIMFYGKLPDKLADIGGSVEDLKEFDLIDDIFLTKEKGIGAHLSSGFGVNKMIALLPKLTASGSYIKWRCVTNVDEKYLKSSNKILCEYSNDFLVAQKEPQKVSSEISSNNDRMVGTGGLLQTQTTAPRQLTPTNRVYYVQAILAQALSQMTAVSTLFSEYTLSRMTLPDSLADVGFSAQDVKNMENNDFIEDVFLTKEKGIGIRLSADVGTNKKIALLPRLAENRYDITWRCITNMDKKYLSIFRNPICENVEDIAAARKL